MSDNSAPLTAVPAAPPASSAPAVPASPADGSVAAPPAASPDTPGIRQFREQYEALKSAYEPWKNLNRTPDDVQRQISTVERMSTEAVQLGERLGYDAGEVRELFARDPVQVLAYLRQALTESNNKPVSANDLRNEMSRTVEQGLKPIYERENARMDREAEFRFDSEFDRLFKENFKDPLPAKAKEALYEMVGQLVGEDAAAIRRLKFDGQVSDIGKHFNAAKTRLLDIFAEWSTAERQRLGRESAPAPAAPGKLKSRLDATLSTGQSVRELFNI